MILAPIDFRILDIAKLLRWKYNFWSPTHKWGYQRQRRYICCWPSKSWDIGEHNGEVKVKKTGHHCSTVDRRWSFCECDIISYSDLPRWYSWDPQVELVIAKVCNRGLLHLQNWEEVDLEQMYSGTAALIGCQSLSFSVLKIGTIKKHPSRHNQSKVRRQTLALGQKVELKMDEQGWKWRQTLNWPSIWWLVKKIF